MFRLEKPVTFLLAFAGASAVLFAVGPKLQEHEARGGFSELRVAEHARLAESAGVWDARCVWHGPSGDVEFRGRETVAVACGGLWVFSTFASEFQGAPFAGRGVRGYDPESKQVVGTWVDSGSTRVMQLAGGFEGDALVLTTEGRDPESGERYVEKHVETRKGANERVFRMLAEREDGEHELMRIVYTRTE